MSPTVTPPAEKQHRRLHTPLASRGWAGKRGAGCVPFFVFYIFSYLLSKSWVAFLGAWCSLPAFRSCFVEFTRRLNALLMNLWGRKCSSRPTPPPSWLLQLITIFKVRNSNQISLVEFQLSYSKSWKMMLWKCCTQYASKFGKLSSGHRTGKGQFSFQSQRKVMPKNAQTTAQLHAFHTLVK